jgi:hypothetical protein
MDKWLIVPPDLEPFIDCALALYSLYRPKKKTLVVSNSRSCHYDSKEFEGLQIYAMRRKDKRLRHLDSNNFFNRYNNIRHMD